MDSIIVDKHDNPVLPVIDESFFQKGIDLGFYTEEDRNVKVFVYKKNGTHKLLEKLMKYEREQPRTPLNKRSWIIKNFGIIDGVRTKELAMYLF